MELVTPELAQALRANWRDQSGRRPPALKLFSPYGAATWLIHSAEPSEPDRLFGLSALTANDDLLLTYLRYNSDRRSLVPPETPLPPLPKFPAEAVTRLQNVARRSGLPHQAATKITILAT